MGNQELNLAEPIKKKIFKNYEDENMRVGICLMQGWRKTMEDTSLAMPNFDGQENSLFGIFDGHGGSIISQFVACNIENILKNSPYYKKSKCERALIDSFILLDELLKNKDIDTFLKKIKIHQKNLNDVNLENAASIINKELIGNNVKNDPFKDYLFFCPSYSDNEINLKYQFPNLEQYLENQKEALEHNKINDVNELNQEYKNNNNSNVKKSENNEALKSKTANNIAFDKNGLMDKKDINDIGNSKTFLKQDFFNFKEKTQSNLIANDIGTTANILLIKKNYFYIANVGDSLSVMYKKKKFTKLNELHKTTFDKEFNRIKKLECKLINYRINGKLNITRALGDLSYKNRNNSNIYEQDVLAIPEVKKYPLDDVDFIIMGSDGFWDYGDDIKTICDNINNELKKNPKKDLCELIGNIFDKGLAKANNYLRGTDNMSCIIIQFLKKN